MWSLLAVFLLCFVQLMSCQVDYDALIKDVCFQRIYICDKHRFSIVASDGLLETSPIKFEEICRRNKAYIACVDKAVSRYCDESMTGLARMTLDNRISLKLFCPDLTWRESYYSSASCINEEKDQIEEKCHFKEMMRVDNRQCVFPEPCDGLQRKFNCAVQEIKESCGETAAEVYKRIRILNEGNLDVVCEFRRLFPAPCQYEFLKEDSKLHKRFGLQKDFDIYSDIAKIKHPKKLAEFEQIKFRKNSNILNDLHLNIKNYLFRLVDVLRHEEIMIGSLTEELFEIYWTNLEFPVQNIVCDKINIASKNVFKCSIKWDLDENKLNAGSFSNWEDKNSEPIPKYHLSDVHRDGFLHRVITTGDNDDAYLEDHRRMGVVPSSGTEFSVESPYPTEPSTESDSESIPETNSDLKTSFVEDVTELSQLRESEDAIDEKLQVVDTKMESSIEKNNCTNDKYTEDCGIRDSVFTNSDMDSKENIRVTKIQKKGKLLRKPQLKAWYESTRSTTEDPFYENFGRFLFEYVDKHAHEKDLELFIKEIDKMRAPDKEIVRLGREEKLVSSNVELSIEEREKLLAREKEEREKNKEKYLAMEIEQLLKKREQQRARKGEMEILMDEQDD